MSFYGAGCVINALLALNTQPCWQMQVYDQPSIPEFSFKNRAYRSCEHVLSSLNFVLIVCCNLYNPSPKTIFSRSENHAVPFPVLAVSLMTKLFVSIERFDALISKEAPGNCFRYFIRSVHPCIQRGQNLDEPLMM